MRETKEFSLDGKTFYISQFPATEGLRLLTALTKLAGPSISKAVSAFKGDATNLLDTDLSKIDLSMFGDAIETLVSQLYEDPTLNLIKRLLATTRYKDDEKGDGKYIAVSDAFDLLFARNYKILFQLLKEVVVFNFGDVFFGSSTAQLQRVK